MNRTPSNLCVCVCVCVNAFSLNNGEFCFENEGSKKLSALPEEY